MLPVIKISCLPSNKAVSLNPNLIIPSEPSVSQLNSLFLKILYNNTELLRTQVLTWIPLGTFPTHL